tara:strand:+ start:83 stop:754 length:672 start_codon:yes stop_codon:yes gene_type:complete
MSGLVTVTEPSIEPISVIEARDHLRLDDDVDETLVYSLILAARQWGENYTGRSFISRTMQMYLDGFSELDSPLWEGTRTGIHITNYQNYIEIVSTPVSAVSSIKYYNDSDTVATWATSNYYVDMIREPARIVLRDTGTYPTNLRAANGLEINFTAGYGTSKTDVPEAIRVALMQYMTFMYEHRGDVEQNNIMPPKICEQLLSPYKILRFGSNAYSKMLKTGIG